MLRAVSLRAMTATAQPCSCQCSALSVHRAPCIRSSDLLPSPRPPLLPGNQDRTVVVVVVATANAFNAGSALYPAVTKLPPSTAHRFVIRDEPREAPLYSSSSSSIAWGLERWAVELLQSDGRSPGRKNGVFPIGWLHGKLYPFCKPIHPAVH